MTRWLLLAAFSLSLHTFAQPAGKDAPGSEAPATGVSGNEEAPEAKAARELVQKYLNAVKAKKFADAKKLTHPKAIDAIAERKKRLGKEDHPMAPWYHEKVDYYLKNFTVNGARSGANGTFIVEATEDNYQVEDKGIAEGEKGAYLVGKTKNKWYVVDKKRGETFTNDSIKLGYKGWFDEVPEAAAAPAGE